MKEFQQSTLDSIYPQAYPPHSGITTVAMTVMCNEHGCDANLPNASQKKTKNTASLPERKDWNHEVNGVLDAKCTPMPACVFGDAQTSAKT
jgi:hypothetical protein